LLQYQPAVGTLAAMTDLWQGPWRSPDRKLLVLRSGLTLAVLGGSGLLASAAAAVLAGPVEALAVLLVVAAATGVVLLVVERRWRAWGYAEREDDLLVRRGVLVRRTSVVPYGRMQYVDVTSGPLERRLGLATVTMHTAAAATDATIPGLLEQEAARLRDRLAALGEARQAGL
jgi:membrane protein YdbS with pleckstrin-like domain